MLTLYAVILNTHYVILNVVKNLLNDNTLSTLSMVGFEEIATSGKALLAMTHTHKRTQRCHAERSEESLGEC